jgi:DNA (cytosine-5)-methyltransferase 1
MIFKSIHTLQNKSDKAFFEELVSVYCKIVRELCTINGLLYQPTEITISDKHIDELKSMGVIDSDADLGLLQKTINKDYTAFIYSVDLYLNNSKVFGNHLDKLSNSKRKLAQQTALKQSKPVVADFFAGAGGLSLGFIKTGYRIGFANDFEEVCIHTYLYNHPDIPSSKVLQADIRNIVDNIEDYISEDVDIVIGGPPCQGFSSANQQRIIDDPRNELYKYYVRAISKLAPKFVVMENVRGMLGVADQVVEDYKAIRATKNGIEYTYDIKYELLNSVNFSVAQSRERLIYIAIRNDVAQDKSISPAEIFKEIKEECSGNAVFNLSDALEFIKPLDAPRVKNTNEIDDEKTGKKIDVNAYYGRSNRYLDIINSGISFDLTYNHKARYVNDINYDIYRLLEPGDDASDEKIADIMPYKNRLHCFKDKYYKLIPNKPSRTITAHLRMDCHSHIHPTQIRAITPREAARCQSFPDDYLFLGPYLKTYMEIGNAVPCLMSQTIAKVIKKYIS